MSTTSVRVTEDENVRKENTRCNYLTCSTEGIISRSFWTGVWLLVFQIFASHLSIVYTVIMTGQAAQGRLVMGSKDKARFDSEHHHLVLNCRRIKGLQGPKGLTLRCGHCMHRASTVNSSVGRRVQSAT